MTDRRLTRWRSATAPVLFASLVIGLWWSTVVVFDIRAIFLPSPADTVRAFAQQPAYLAREMGETAKHVLIGYALAVVDGVIMAILLAWSRTVQEAALPVLAAVNAIPKVALAPLLLVWFGYGVSAKVVMVVLICFFPIVFNTIDGLRSTPTDLQELGRSLTATRWRTFRKIRLPWALPQIFTGLQIGASLAVVGAVVAEISQPNHGLGAVIVAAGANTNTPMAFAAIILLALLGAGLYYAVRLAEKILLPWAREISDVGG